MINLIWTQKNWKKEIYLIRGESLVQSNCLGLRLASPAIRLAKLLKQKRIDLVIDCEWWQSIRSIKSFKIPISSSRKFLFRQRNPIKTWGKFFLQKRFIWTLAHSAMWLWLSRLLTQRFCKIKKTPLIDSSQSYERLSFDPWSLLRAASWSISSFKLIQNCWPTWLLTLTLFFTLCNRSSAVEFPFFKSSDVREASNCWFSWSISAFISEKLAQNESFDTRRQPSGWHSQRTSDSVRRQNGAQILQRHQGMINFICKKLENN